MQLLEQVTPQKPLDMKQSHSVQAMARQQQTELLNQELKRELNLKSQLKDPYHLNPLENTP